MKTILFVLLALTCCINIAKAQTVTDIDGNVYNTITIGIQTWMLENLKVTHYNNNDPIPTTSTPTLDINHENSPKYQWAYDGTEQYVETFGRLYTWYAATDSRELCPEGWHLPSDGEWIILRDYLANHGYGYNGMMYFIAKSMATTTLWLTDTLPGAVGYDLESNNSSGFSGVPSGMRNSVYNYFTNLYWGAHWWASTLDTTQTKAWRHGLFKRYGYMLREPHLLHNGFSVRCVKDQSTQTNDGGPKLQIKLYPNPVVEILYVDIDTDHTTMQIFNLAGQTLIDRKLINGANEVDVSKLSAGMYTLRVTGDESEVSYLFMKK